MDKLKRLKITIQNRLNEARNNGTGVARVMNSTLSEMLEVVNRNIKGNMAEVVRCKDCIYQDGKDGQCPVQSTGDPFYDYTPDDDWFCGDGKRKEGGGT